MDIGTKIKTARLQKGYSQEELGKLVGVQRSAVSKWENGSVVNIKRSVLQKISEILEIPPIELIQEEPVVTIAKGALDKIAKEYGWQPEPVQKKEVKTDYIIEMDGASHTLVELYDALNTENKSKVFSYIEKLLEDQNRQVVQALARLNRIKGSDETNG